jgi:hypothetical protein
VIAEGSDGALLTVVHGEGAQGAAIVNWRGRTEDGEERLVATAGHPLARLQPWLATELAVATSSAKAADLSVDWRGLTEDAGLVPGAKLALPVKITRADEKAVVRLSLVTSQPPVVANRQVDPNRQLRIERPVEVNPGQNEPQIEMFVPAELASDSYDVAVKAELLTADKQRVIQSAYTAVRRMPVRRQLVLSLTGPAEVTAALDSKTGATVKLAGKLERREGIAGDAQISVTGLPPGARADNVSVKAGATDFEVSVILPVNAPPGRWARVKIFASADYQGARVRSSDVELSLQITRNNK